MPLPTPKDNEQQEEFIGRCMADDSMVKEYPEGARRSGVCFSQWRGVKQKTSEKAYDPSSEDDNAVLMTHFRTLTSRYQAELAGEETEFDSSDDVLKTACTVVGRIEELGAVSFPADQMKPESQDLLNACLGAMKTSGPHLIPPYGELIAERTVTAIPKGASVPEMEKFGILSSGTHSYGYVRFYPPEKLDRREFEARAEEHRMSESCDMEEIHYYRVREFFPFDRPRKIRRPESVKEAMSDGRFFESTYTPRDWDLGKMSLMDMLQLHGEHHDEAQRFALENPRKDLPEGLVERHIVIRYELKRRGMHSEDLTELDRQAAILEKDGEDDFIDLSKLSELWGKSMMIRRPMLSIVGEAVKTGRGRDIQVNVNWPSWDEKFLCLLEYRLKSVLPAEWRSRVHLVPDDMGPVVDSVPIADLNIGFYPAEARELANMPMGSMRERRLSEELAKQSAMIEGVDKMEPELISTIDTEYGKPVPVESVEIPIEVREAKPGEKADIEL